MAFRYDLGKTFKATKTPEGFLVANGLPTRAGIFVYRKADGSEVHELRPPEEVFAPASLSSLAAATLTSGHPAEPVNADNSAGLSVGHLGEQITHDDTHVQAKVYVKDAKAIKLVESGKQQQLSCGYTCDMDDTPGTYQGQKYDTVQRNIQYNHVALVEVGRAGPENRIRLDSNDAVEIETPIKETPMQKIKIDGVDYEVSEAVAQAYAKREATVAQEKGEAVKVQAKADSLAGDLQKVQAELQVAKDPKVLAAAVASKLAVVKVAEKAAVKHDGLSDEEIRLAVVKAAKPEIKMDGKSAEYVACMFDIVAEEQGKKEVAALRHDSVNAAPTDAETQDHEAKRAKARQDQADAWKQPLTVNKVK